jgi:hypothetical protein
MSQVKISGNASGTGIFTIASPNSNTNRTLDLPDAAGTIQVSGNPISGTTGTFTGLVDISAAGAGQIQFPATQNASANANTLDDYEEGTWTATLTFRTSSTGSLTYVRNTGRYIKIGALVFVSVYINWSANGFSASSGALQLSGLPFAPSGETNYRGGLNITYTSSPWTGFTVYSQAFRVEAGETNMVFNYANATTGSMDITITSHTSIDATGDIMITGCYSVI